MARARKNCRRTMVQRNSKSVRPVKETLSNGHSKLSKTKISSSVSLDCEVIEPCVGLKVECAEVIEDCEDLTSSDECVSDFQAAADLHPRDDQRDEVAESERSDTPSDNTIFICHASTVSADESSPLSFSPSLSPQKKSDGKAENGSLARRLFKTSADVTSRVIARPCVVSETDEEIEDKKKPWKCFDSPWDFGFHFQLTIGNPSEETISQPSASFWIESLPTAKCIDVADNTDRIEETKDDIETVQGNTYTTFDMSVGAAQENRHTTADRYADGCPHSFVCGYSNYWSLFPTFHWTGYTDAPFYFNRPYPTADFWLPRNIYHGAVTYHPFPDVHWPYYHSYHQGPIRP